MTRVAERGSPPESTREPGKARGLMGLVCVLRPYFALHREGMGVRQETEAAGRPVGKLWQGEMMSLEWWQC